jgi:tetratricopeptide (TPR) repeat protein
VEELEPATMPEDVALAARDPAKRLGPFVLVRELGHGSVGVVHLAWDLRLNRRVALKTLIDMTPDHFLRFAREARAAAKLEHPGIVRVLDLAQVNGRPYIAMEVLDGRTLKDLLRDGTLRTRPLVTIVRDVARALGHAHAQGIVHRDVKPGNIIVDARGQARITDFGIARDDTANAEKLTTTGTTLGTPEYMSPEQASDARDVTPASDVYALGTILFEGLTGKTPHAGGSELEVMFKVMSGDVKRPSALVELPRALENVVMRCLDRIPERRYPDGEALARDLDAFLGGERGPAPPAGARAITPGRLGVLAFAALLVIAAALATFAALSARANDKAAAAKLLARAEAALRDGRLAEALGEANRAAGLDSSLARARALRDEASRLIAVADKQREAERKKAAEELEARTRLDEKLAQAEGEKDPGRRLALLDAAVALAPSNPRVYVARAHHFARLAGDARVRHQRDQADAPDEKARAELARALELDPESTAAHLERALLSIRAGRFPDTTQDLASVDASRRDDEPSAIARILASFGTKQPTLLQLEPLRAFTKAHPRSDTGWVFRADLELVSGHLDAAIEAATHAIECGAVVRGRSLRAAYRIRAGDLATAEDDTRHWLEESPDDPAALELRGELRLARGDLAGALADGDRVLELGDRVGGYELRGRAHAALGDTTAAREDLEAALAAAVPLEKPGVRLIRARLRENAGDLDGALQETEVWASPGPLPTVALLDLTLERAHLFDRAHGSIQGAEQVLGRGCQALGDAAELLVEHASLALRRGDLVEGKELLEKAAAVSGRASHLRFPELEADLARRTAALASRLAPFEATLATKPDDTGALIERARLLHDSGDADRARADLDRAIDTAPDKMEKARALVARCTLGYRSYEEASADASLAVELAPESGTALALKALYEAAGRQPAARADADRAVALSPTDAGVAVHRAKVLLALGAGDEALAEATRAVTLEPHSRDALELHAQCLEMRGDRAGAVADYRAIAGSQTDPDMAELWTRWAAALERRSR